LQFSKKHHRNFTLTAVDNIENTHLNSNSFDAAISQYGIEYSNLNQSIPEIKRLLKPQGRFFAITHNNQSKIILQAKESLEQISICLDKHNLLSLTQEFIQNIGLINNKSELIQLESNAKIIKLRTDYNQSIQYIEKEIACFENT